MLYKRIEKKIDKLNKILEQSNIIDISYILGNKPDVVVFKIWNIVSIIVMMMYSYLAHQERCIIMIPEL